MVYFKRLFLFLTAFFILLSCDSESCGESGCGIDVSDGITLYAAGDCKEEILTSKTLSDAEFFHVKILDSTGKTVKTQSFSKISGKMTVSDLGNLKNATVKFYAYTKGNNSEPAWMGEATNVSFTEGETTSLDVILYPIYKTACFPVNLSTGRFGQTVTKLNDGRFLVAGGFSTCSSYACEASKLVEIIDPETGTVSRLADLSIARGFHTAKLLPDGSVLIAGGVSNISKANFSVNSIPSLPFEMESSVQNMERYTPSYPKINVAKNGYGTVVSNKTEVITVSGNPFAPFQSYKWTEPTSGSITLYANGGVINGELSQNVYGIKFQTSPFSYSGAELYGSSSDRDPSIMPIMEEADIAGTIFSIGGKGDGSTEFAEKVTPTSTTSWGYSGSILLPNLFFAGSFKSNGTVYTAGGLKYDSSLSSFEQISSLYGYNISAKTLYKKEIPLSVAFPEMFYYERSDMAVVVGGVPDFATMQGSSTIQRVTLAQSSANKTSINMEDSRVFSSSVLDKNGFLFVIGGTPSLGLTPSARVEIFNIESIE